MNAWGISDKGKVRKQNQDVFFTYVRPEEDLAACIVCDGMGGAKAGDVASRLAAEGFMAALVPSLQSGLKAETLAGIVAAASEQANMAVWGRAQTDPACTGMGTTLVAFAFSGGSVAVANAGDSRAYRVRKREIERITRDHSIVEDMVRSGELSPEEARRYPGRNIITRALGTDANVPSDVFELELSAGECLLLCSDGLTNLVGEQELLAQITAPDRAGCCERLLNLALSRGAPDNVTAVLFER